MFGHSDDSHNDDHDEPQHDAVLGDDEAGTVHPDAPQPQEDGSSSPAFTSVAPTSPEPKHDEDDKPTTEEHGHHDAAPASVANPELLDLKQNALQQLTPLVDHLDQTPEEKFRTTMMMIQASDNQALLKDAYGAAQKITDEKAKAQALLDIVNEINYFTHQD